MNLQKSGWKFDETVVPIFDDHVKKSVPLYDEIHELISNIAGWFLQDNTNVYDIGTSTGKVLKELINKYNKNIKYIGIDSSKDMCDKLEKENLNIEIINVDVSKDFCFQNASLITSILTLQFIGESERQSVINSIYRGLNKGSAFILVEKVIGSNSRFNEIWTDLYYELKLKNGLSLEHVFNKSRALRGVMRPYTVKENTELLEIAGFKDIDIFFKWNNFVGFIAIK